MARLAKDLDAKKLAGKTKSRSWKEVAKLAPHTHAAKLADCPGSAVSLSGPIAVKQSFAHEKLVRVIRRELLQDGHSLKAKPVVKRPCPHIEG